MTASAVWHMFCEQKYPGKQAAMHPNFAQPCTNGLQNGLPSTLQRTCPKVKIKQT